MKHRRSFLPYLLILIGIILPIFLMQHLMQTTAHKGGVAKKDIPSNAVTSTASAQGMKVLWKSKSSRHRKKSTPSRS